MVGARKTNFEIHPVSVPSLRTEQFEDLSVYTGAEFINKDKGMKLESIKEHQLGWLDRLVVKDTEAREDAMAIGGGGTKPRPTLTQGVFVSPLIEERIEVLKKQIEETRIDSHKKLLERRIASLASSIGVIRVGASSDIEALYKKHKIEDAVYASKAALEEGYLPGGGVALLEIAKEIEKDDASNLLIPALKAPYYQIQENAEQEIEIPQNVIDPSKAIRLAVKHAISVTGTLATVKAIIPELREKSPGEGYKDIADAILAGVKFWARQQGLIKENEIEAEKDLLRTYEEQELVDS